MAVNTELFTDLLLATRTMTIATTGASGAWSAPVYFLFHQDCFYFFSSAASRHIEEALSNGACAVSLFSEDGDWRHIRGLQMCGSIAAAPYTAPTSAVLARYTEKFPTVASLFPDSLRDLETFSEKSHTRLYRFQPSQVLLVDNAAGFGSRREIDPGSLEAATGKPSA
ncbi:MAG: pyridoxamine 5'-phosphate oxidase family protein [Halioglobus sp.]|nr:pyridoxamine 5'-phosphate oxidase family protein [Halioglobus sp.]